MVKNKSLSIFNFNIFILNKFIVKILLFFLLPALLLAGVSEYSIRQIPNDYSYKNSWMTKNCKNLNILCLGSSTVFFGINPNHFKTKAFNASHISQTLNYDNFIFNKFINQMDSLKYLLLDINYISPFTSLENSEEWWRVKYYSIYYDNDFHRGELKYNYELAVHNLSTFESAGNGILLKLGMSNYSKIKVNELGFGTNYSLNKRTKNWNDGKEEALKHSIWLKREKDLDLIDNNKIYVNDILKKCAARKIKVLLISTPVSQTYVSNLNNNYLKKKTEFCNSFKDSSNNISYIDFSSDNRFIDEDFFDANHLNETGARKFTIIINDILSKWK